jgi:hypothetical protein
MEDASKAKASIAALNDFNLKGSRIRVEVCIDWKANFCILCYDLLDFNNAITKFWSFIVRIF